MYTTYHLRSAQDVNTDILNAINATFKSKPITIIVEEGDELSSEMKAILDDRLKEAENTYLSVEQSIDQLNQRYSL